MPVGAELLGSEAAGRKYQASFRPGDIVVSKHSQLNSRPIPTGGLGSCTLRAIDVVAPFLKFAARLPGNGMF